MNYLGQKAAPWVSIAVLAGGLAAAVILSFLSRIESSIDHEPTAAEKFIETIEY